MARKRFSPKEFRLTIRGYFCVYCGESSECLDHFPPYSACLSGFLLPACKHCNAIAGTEHPFDFRARAKHVNERLREKYQKILDTPEWSAAEMRPLGYSLKQMVKSWSDRRKIALRRVAWNTESYLAMVPSAKPFLELLYNVEMDPERQKAAIQKRLKLLAETEAA